MSVKNDEWFDEMCKKVAEVDCETLSDVFFYTNHVECAWWEHDCVTAFKETRSTSVGDLVVNPAGNFLLCCPIGWKLVMV